MRPLALWRATGCAVRQAHRRAATAPAVRRAHWRDATAPAVRRAHWRAATAPAVRRAHWRAATPPAVRGAHCWAATPPAVRGAHRWAVLRDGTHQCGKRGARAAGGVDSCGQRGAGCLGVALLPAACPAQLTRRGARFAPAGVRGVQASGFVMVIASIFELLVHCVRDLVPARSDALPNCQAALVTKK